MTDAHHPGRRARTPQDAHPAELDEVAFDGTPILEDGVDPTTEDCASEQDASLDLVWLGDAERGLEEFTPQEPPRDLRPMRSRPAGRGPTFGPGAGGEIIDAWPVPAWEPAAPWRLRRVVVPALMVLAGVALVSNVERRAPDATVVMLGPPATAGAFTERRSLPSSPASPVRGLAGLPGTLRVQTPAPAARITAPRRTTAADMAAARAIAAPSRVVAPRSSPVANRSATPSAIVAAPAEARTATVSMTRDVPASLEVSVPAPTVALPPVVDDSGPADIDAERPAGAAAGVAPVAAAAPRPRDPDPAVAAPRELAARAIERVLAEYRSAFNRRDAGAAAAVWPTVDTRALARAFDGLEDQAVQFDQCQYEIGDDRAEAACRGTASYVPSVGSRTPRTAARRWRFRLGRTSGRWTIVSVDAR